MECSFCLTDYDLLINKGISEKEFNMLEDKTPANSREGTAPAPRGESQADQMREQYGTRKQHSQPALLRYVGNEIVESRSWQKFIGVVLIAFGMAYAAMGLLMIIFSGHNPLNKYMVGGMGTGGMLMGFLYVALAAFLAYFGSLYLSCAREFENADITASPGDFKSGMDKLALIIRIQGVVMLVGALLFGLALLFGIVAALRAMLSA